VNDLKVTIKNPHQKIDQKKVPDYVKTFAKNMERQFLDYMIDKMDSAGVATEQSNAAKSYYKSLLRSERADLMSKVRNGIGIQDMIINDFMKKYHQPELAIKNYQQKGEGNE
jgi:Rod binding domain-containing protein